jgi:formylglycine-generating enzyme required for sulfatase activity
MADPAYPNFGGITRSSSSGSYSYNTIAGRENMPVVYVSFYDSLRFANWLHNGQPTGAQGSNTTEDGAYDMSRGSSVERKTGAKVFLVSEDEWYKAAYYKGGGTNAGYWEYPAGSDTQTTCMAPGATANTANCNSAPGPTDVGSYTGSASPSGTFDQGGNLWEWNEAIILGTDRGLRGGFFFNSPNILGASYQSHLAPGIESFYPGFRVASVPTGWVPPSPLPSLTSLGISTLCSVLMLVGLRRLRG